MNGTHASGTDWRRIQGSGTGCGSSVLGLSRAAGNVGHGSRSPLTPTLVLCRSLLSTLLLADAADVRKSWAPSAPASLVGLSIPVFFRSPIFSCARTTQHTRPPACAVLYAPSITNDALVDCCMARRSHDRGTLYTKACHRLSDKMRSRLHLSRAPPPSSSTSTTTLPAVACPRPPSPPPKDAL